MPTILTKTLVAATLLGSSAEMRGGEKGIVFKFDDIGCAVFWLRDKTKEIGRAHV